MSNRSKALSLIENDHQCGPDCGCGKEQEAKLAPAAIPLFGVVDSVVTEFMNAHWDELVKKLHEKVGNEDWDKTRGGLDLNPLIVKAVESYLGTAAEHATEG